MDSELNPAAVYGCLPFDNFALALWDYTAPLHQGQEQWNLLAKKWLSMSHVERSPYWEIHYPGDPPCPDAPYLPTQEQIDRVLAPHQTIKERNLSLLMASSINKPVWIRTCYAPELQAAYEETIEAAECLHEVDRILLLDNKDLYGGFGDDWAQILLRLPLLPDAVPYFGGDPAQDEAPNCDEPPDYGEKFMPLYNAAQRDKQAVYLVDEEALRNKVVKILYLDNHGCAVWHNRIAPKHIWEFEANYFKGGALGRITEGCYPGGDEDLVNPGARLVYGE